VRWTKGRIRPAAARTSLHAHGCRTIEEVTRVSINSPNKGGSGSLAAPVLIYGQGHYRLEEWGYVEMGYPRLVLTVLAISLTPAFTRRLHRSTRSAGSDCDLVRSDPVRDWCSIPGQVTKIRAVR